MLLVNAPAQVESLLHSLEQAASGISLHVNAHKMEYMCFNQKGDNSTQNGGFLKLGRSVSSTENDINVQLVKALTTFERWSII